MKISIFMSAMALILLSVECDVAVARETVNQQVENRNLAVNATTPAESNHKVALVIGNADYKTSPLKNPINDARAMSAKLKELGFDVLIFENLQQKQLGKVLREFREKLHPGAVALFFYAGHGLQVKGINYLPTVDADIESVDDVPLQSLDVNKVFDVMAEAGTRLNLVFLDACRNNPYTRSFRSMDGGLAKVNAPSGTMISFATRPGSVARDGDGKNGLYTSKLLNAMDIPNLPIEKLLKNVVSQVKLDSKGNQEPWSEGSIEGDFYFRGSEQSSEEVEKKLWLSIKESPTKATITTYLNAYPSGMFVEQAKETIKKLDMEAQQEALRREEEAKQREDEAKQRQEAAKQEAIRREEEAKLREENEKRLEEQKNQLAEAERKIKEREQKMNSEKPKNEPEPKHKTIFVPPTF